VRCEFALKVARRRSGTRGRWSRAVRPSCRSGRATSRDGRPRGSAGANTSTTGRRRRSAARVTAVATRGRPRLLREAAAHRPRAISCYRLARSAAAPRGAEPRGASLSHRGRRDSAGRPAPRSRFGRRAAAGVPSTDGLRRRPSLAVASATVRLIVARCSIAYTGRLSTNLPEATRLLMMKADGSFMVWCDGGPSVKP
jgi:hypothetical protein